MKINSKIRHKLRLQQLFFYILLLIAVSLLAKLSLQYDYSTDLTANSRHSLSETTIALLDQIDTPITIQAFIRPNSDYQTVLASLLDRYQNQNQYLIVKYINPDLAPDLTRMLGIQQDGELVITREQHEERVYDLSEQSLTNALISVSRQQEQWLIFMEGHGERDPVSQANFGLSLWSNQLKQKGFKVGTLNLAEHRQIPDNTAVLILASPETSWLPGEITLIQDYINQGGNMLWLTEPGSNHHLSSLAELLDIEFVAGTVVDPNAELLGINDPQFVLITDYANHPIGHAVSNATLFPQATAIEISSDENWQSLPLLISQTNTWSETGPLDEHQGIDFVFDQDNDTAGPLNIGLLLSRENDDEDMLIEQRVVVIGDGDFLSNTYLGNGANLSLGVAIINWLAKDDALISIPVKTTLDTSLELTRTETIIIGLGFLIILPLALLLSGSIIWWRRRRR